MSAELLRRANPRPKDGALLRFLYRTAPGRVALKLLCMPALSRMAGRFLDSPLSRPLIAPFLRKNGIRRADYLPESYRCFNDCFTRRIRPELRPVDMAADALIAPCDGLLSAYRIEAGAVIPAKQSRYAIADLLGSEADARAFEGGVCLVFRLCVENYHRYCYVDGGRALRWRKLAGELHTVRPIALESEPVFVRNCREATLMQTDHLGLCAQIEVGAMLVGRIANHPAPPRFERGMEKGMFLYGGSTVILLLRADCAKIEPEAFELAARECEIPVRMGERIAALKAEKCD